MTFVFLTKISRSLSLQVQFVNSEPVMLLLTKSSSEASQTVQSENVQCSIVALYKESTRVLAVIFLNVHFVSTLAFPANKWVLPVFAFFFVEMASSESNFFLRGLYCAVFKTAVMK